MLTKKLDRALVAGIKKVVPRRCPKPVMMNVNVRDNVISATNLESSITLVLERPFQGRGLLPLDLFDTVELDVTWDKSGNVRTATDVVAVKPYDEYPDVPLVDADEVLLTGQPLDGCWDDLGWCGLASDHEGNSRYALQSVAMFADSICGTDGRRAHASACVEFAYDGDAPPKGLFPLMVPAIHILPLVPMFKALDAAGAEFTFEVIGTRYYQLDDSSWGMEGEPKTSKIDENNNPRPSELRAPAKAFAITAVIPGVLVLRWRTILCEGRYPKIADVFANRASYVPLADQLGDAVVRMIKAPVYTLEAPGIDIDPDGIYYKAENGKRQEVFQTGLPISMSLDARFLRDAISRCTEAAVTNADNAVHLRSSDGSCLAVLMPLSKDRR